MHKIEISSPCVLATYLRNERIPLKMSCGGHGSCKTCRVILDGQPVLACQTHVEPGAYEIGVPQSGSSAASIQIDLSTLQDALRCEAPRWHTFPIHVESAEAAPNRSNRSRLEAALPQGISLSPRFFDSLPHDAIQGTLEIGAYDNCARFPLSSRRRGPYAIAVDIGTTTVGAALIDLRRKEIVASKGKLNAQYLYSEDLVARIAFCHTPELLGEMHDLILRRTLIPLLQGLLKESGVNGREVLTTVFAGNSPMIHILLGLDPTGMGGWPFNGIDFAPQARCASDYRLPGERLEFVPSQSAYLGGDIISGLAFVDFENAEDGTLFLDLGTNAEMALKTNDRLLCTAVPAGPAFEGGGFPCGVSAIPGAIDYVWEEGENLHFTTIGSLPAAGICGSGIISYVAAAFRAGILRKKGRYSRRHPGTETRDILGENQRLHMLTEEIYVSEADVSNFLQAKAAVFAGIETLCRVAGVDPFQLSKLHLAGNFGRRIRARDIMGIGLIPPLAPDRVVPCGNTSLKGAIYATLDREVPKRMARLVERLEFVELNGEPTFQNDFIDALFIPHLKHEWTPAGTEELRPAV
jgi:uncharacterized 2Fe-2S/4Fe-4S cluster protein (DUF4445 family)